MTDSKENDEITESRGPVTKGMAEPAINEPRRPGPRFFNLVITIVVSAFVSTASLFVYDAYFAQKIVSIDIKGYVDNQRNLYMSRKISDEQLDEIRALAIGLEPARGAKGKTISIAPPRRVRCRSKHQ